MCHKWQRKPVRSYAEKIDKQQENKGRSKVNELEYEDTEGRDIKCDTDGNNFVIESVEIQNQRDSHVQQIYLPFKDRIWR